LLQIVILRLQLIDNVLVDHGTFSLLVFKVVTSALQLIDIVLGLKCWLHVVYFFLAAGLILPVGLHHLRRLVRAIRFSAAIGKDTTSGVEHSIKYYKK
jgi:hypothetical protein